MLPSRDAAGGMLPSRALAAAPDGPLRNATGTGGANTNRMPVNPDNAPCGIRGLSRTGDTMDTMRQRILVVDDDPSLAEMLTIVLRGEGFDTAVIGDGTQALTAVRELRPDLVLLDLMLPGMNGIDVCRVLRADSGVPIVMLTAKTDTVDVVLGLESGADDYVMKPFKPKELVARVRARLRRNEDEPAEMLSIADIDIDVPAHKVTRQGEQIALTPLEFDLLVALARKPRQVFTRDVLLEQVWGYRHPADTRLVNVHVQRLRAKVEKDPENPQVVLTVRGVGYKAGPP
jgi:two-component system response regulator MtrA